MTSFIKDNSPKGKLPYSKFRSPVGKYYTAALFVETANDRATAIYTLKDDDFERDGIVYKSLKKLYLECLDPVGYEFVEQHMGSWKQWQQICNSKTVYGNRQIKVIIAEWKQELELKIRSQATKAIMLKSLDPDGGFQAAKYLAQAGWVRDKPKAAEVAAKKKIQQSIEDDAERIGLKLVK